MNHTQVTPKIRPHHGKAEAHRRMALAALRGDHSLSVRLTRYNHHMTKARAIEALLRMAHAGLSFDEEAYLASLPDDDAEGQP